MTSPLRLRDRHAFVRMTRPADGTAPIRPLLVLAALLAVCVPLVCKAAPQAAALSDRDQADLKRIEAYLDGIKTLKAEFDQTNPDGSLVSGDVYMLRPGKMRFEYDPPVPLLLIVGYGVGFLIDKQLHQTNNFPVLRSPLSIFLADRVKFSDDVTIDAIDHLPGQLQLTVHQTNAADEGQLTLVFADKPMTLLQWSVVDAQRRETRVSLFKIETGGAFDSKLFLNAGTNQGGQSTPTGPKSNN